MGLLKHLLFWPVTGPLFLTRFSLDKVRDTVRDELTDESRVREELMALQLELELGEIDEETYVEREAELMRELREVRRWRRRFGMGVRGGPVRVAEEQRGGPPAADDGRDEDAGDDGRGAPPSGGPDAGEGGS